MASNDHAAAAWLTRFMQDMLAWERKFYPLMRENGHLHHQQASDELKPIFETYLVPNEKNFKRVHAPSVGFPPEYDPAQNTIEKVEEAGKKVVIEVQSHVRARDLFRYTLVAEGDGYRISKKEVFDEFKDKWQGFHF